MISFPAFDISFDSTLPVSNSPDSPDFQDSPLSFVQIHHTGLISPAYGQGGGSMGGADFFGSFILPLVLIFAVFYFLLIRPQNKKIREHKQMIDALRRGDKVVTGGGIMGSVTKVDNETEVTIEIAQGVQVKVLRHTITDILNKPHPAQSQPPSASSSRPSPKTTRKTTSATGTRKRTARNSARKSS